MDPLAALTDSSAMIQQFASILGMGFDPNPLHSTVVQNVLNPPVQAQPGTYPAPMTAGQLDQTHVSPSSASPGFSAFGFSQNELLLGAGLLGLVLFMKKR